MVPSSLHAVILFLLLLAVRATRAELKTVSPNPDCDSSATHTLDKVLQNITSDNLVIALASGTHCLLNPTVVQSVSNITLIGPDNTSAIITCTKNIGLAFLNISILHLVNVRIRECGLTGDNLMQVVDQTRALVQLNFNIPNDIQVAVYAAHVTDLHMDQVTITNTTGIGLVGINIVGECEIQSCQFSHNIRKQHDCGATGHFVTDLGGRIGGGAYFLFQDFIGYDITTCKNTNVYSFHINDSHFLDNSDCSNLPNEEFVLRQKQSYFIGGGGGLGVVFAQVCYSVNITTTSTVFEDNSATHGSGAHVGIFQGVSNTHVEFEDCQFTGNGVPLSTTNLSFTTHGGAIGVLYDLVSTDRSVPLFIPSRNISLKVKNSNFTDNVATKGGAVIITSLATSAVAETTDVAYFYFDNCIFTANRAIHGAAALLTELKFSGRILGIQIWMANLTVSNNQLESLGFIAPVFTMDSVAVFEVQAINITLAGSCLFDSNTGTAFEGLDSVIGIAGEVKFSNNWGLYGGAVNLNGLSHFVVLPNSSLEFISNSARVYGGAVYVSLIAFLPNFDCFLYFDYDQYEYCENCDFNTNNFTVSFINNTADVAGGTIHGSALMSCPWLSSLQIDSNENILQVLEQNFSDHFVFTPDPIGSQNVQTSIAKVEIDASTDGPPYTVAPGEMKKVVIQPMDTLGQSIPAILGSFADQDAPSTLFVTFDSGPIKIFPGDNINDSTTLTVLGQENASVSLIIFALDLAGSRLTLLSTKVHLTECPFGFQYNSSSHSCVCRPNLLERRIKCNLSDLTLSVPSGMWVGPLDDESDFAVAHCIRALCQPGVATIPVSNSTSDFDQQCRPGLNRGGLLCSSCKKDYSNVFGGIHCRKCTNNSIAIILLFLVLGVLLIVFLVVFRVNISTGYLNGIIFWCNILSLYKEVLVPRPSFLGITFLANWLTLNWGIETCFHVGMSAIERSWWQLCFSIYLFILMALIRVIFRCCKNVDGKTAISTIQAIATLLMMCYISILQFCIELLSYVHIYTEDGKNHLRWRVDPTMEYFMNTHGILAFVACLLLVLYVLPFPIILLFPTVLYKSKWLHKYKPIYDAFWHPLKPQYRFWLGARLMFRWVLFFVAYFYSPPRSTFVSAFFLLILLFLQMQLQPFHFQMTNTLDSAFILSLLFLFLGSLFYNEQQDNWKRATGYSLTLIVLTYLGIGAVFLYHLYSQFPKIRGFVLKYVAKCEQKNKVVLRVPQSAPEEVDSIGGDQEESGDEDEQPRLRVVGYTSFRESLLDDEGSVEIETYTAS